jgi:chromosome segregation ATPase
MQNPTLINGFEDVLTFISQQAERIKRLEQDKATLVRENVELGEELDQYKEELFEAHHQYDVLKERLQTLENLIIT